MKRKPILVTGIILVAGIAHAAANTAFAFLPNLDWTDYNWTVAVAALVMILVDRMWKKLPPDHPAVYCEIVLMAEDQKKDVSARRKTNQLNPQL